MLIPSHLQLEPSNSRTRVPAGGINLIASIDFESDESTTATLSSSTKVLQGDDAISSAQVATPNHSNQQYSIYAITDAAANIAERYAYTAYGQPTILDAAATVIATSAISNRYTYTAREWDATVGLYHFRARWMSGLTGRFLTRDPIGFEGGSLNIQEFCHSKPLIYMDPTGMQLLANPLPPVMPPAPVSPVVGVGVGVGTAGGGLTAGGCAAAVGPAVIPGTILGVCIYECPVIGTKCTLQGPLTQVCYYICPVKCPPKAKTIDHCLGLSDDDARAAFCNGLSPASKREQCRRHIYESQNNWNNYCRFLFLP
jgi:RHS repeat-associated protein